MDKKKDHPAAKSEDERSVANISVQMVSEEDKLAKRILARKKHGKLKLKKKDSLLWNFQNKIILFTLILFILGVVTWTLLWLFIVQAENKDALYFAGLFRVANIEFLPEYRQKESKEFLSVAKNVQHVMNLVYTSSSFSKFYKQTTVSEVSNNNNGGLLVHFWIVFVVPQAKGQVLCEDCVAAVLKDSIQTSVINRTSVGSLQGLAVDMDSIVLSAGLRSDYWSSTGTGTNCMYDMYADRLHERFPLDIHTTSGSTICYFKLTASVGHLIRLSIVSLHIEADNCITDSLTVYDSLMPIAHRILYRACEPAESLVSLVSTNNLMLVMFKAAQIKEQKEFHGYLEVITQERCGKAIVTEEKIGYEGRITSPYYPSYYPPKCLCAWNFQTPQKSLGIALKFHNYAISEKNIKGCERGWWKINEHMYCGHYVDHQTVFHIASSAVSIELQCSSKVSEKPLLVEYGSYNISQPCPPGHFKCSTGLCIRQMQRCDGINNCLDESDELFCVVPEWNCNSSFTIQDSPLACNGVSDCENGKDEQNCTHSIPCTNHTFQCRNNICIRKQNAKCDGTVDCIDGSDESSCSCGSSKSSNPNSRIVGGTNTEEGEWPWQVSLHFVGAAYCGASVISKEWLVSAAHCFQGSKLADPRAWSAHLGMQTQGHAKFVSAVRRIIVHEYYNTRNYDYDIALLQLSKPWPDTMSHIIQPICVPPFSHKARSGDKCWITGWGQKKEADDEGSADLQKAEVKIIDQTLCHSTYGIITARMFCAGLMSGKRDGCKECEHELLCNYIYSVAPACGWKIQESLHIRYCPAYQECLCQKYCFFKWMRSCFWRRCLLGILPMFFLIVTVIVLVLHYSFSPAFSFIYVGGSVEIPNVTYTSDFNDPKSQKFLLQAEAIQNYFAETYESSFLGKYYLKSVVAAFSEGESGLRAFYWSTFRAPQDVVAPFKSLIPMEIKRMSAKQAAHMFSSSGEEDFDLVTMELFASFDLYAKPGNNRTLTLMNPKKSFYQWRLRVPSNYVVRLVVITLHGVTPERCASHHLSAYDFLLPLQNKIITRWCGPGGWNPPIVRLTSSSNVMLLTFSLDRREESSFLKAHFQAVPKIMCGGHYISWNGTLSSPYYPSYYPPNIDCSWIIRAPLPGYKLSLKILIMQIQEKSPGSSKCDKDWLEIDGVRYCKAFPESNRNREYGYSVAINFHSDELVTHTGFYIEYRAFSHTDRCSPGQLNCGDGKCKHQYKTCKDDDSCAEDSDENNCSYESCSPYAYKCLNGKCLLKPNPECDGKRDCADGSDEMNCACGRHQLKKNRIVGGEDARSGKWPWQASLHVGAHGHVCGASLISHRWLLSAAHCFLDSDSVRYSVPSGWRAYMGLHTITEKSNRVAMRSIKRIVVHPQYDHSISDYDITLLEMETPVFFSELVQPICLPSTSRVFVYGTVCYVTGWGAIKENSHLAKTLQEARVRIINQSVCKKLYGNLITSHMLCAGNLNGGVDACQGDSGGPLACTGKGNRWYLAGIVSWGEGCARHNRPGVYTKVTALYDWIRQNTN